MDLSQLLYKRLSEDASLSSILARFSGSPAVFNTEFPGDQQAGWEGKQYPRIAYMISRQANAERSASGQLRISVYDEANMMRLEAIEDSVRDCLQNILMLPDGGVPVCFAWQRTDPYVIEGRAIFAKEIIFDILEYPDQATIDPDPVKAMNTFLKESLPSAFIVGVDQMESCREAAGDSPIIYARAESYETDRTTYALSWLNCRIAIHVIAPTANDRSRWVRRALDLLATAGEALMPDGSPMLFLSISASNNMDYLSKGQVMVKAQYAVERPYPDAPLIQSINYGIRQEE